MTAEQVEAFFAARVKAFARQDIAALVADYTEDCVLESSSLGVFTGRAAVENYYRQLFRRIPDVRVAVTGAMFVSGNEAVVPAAFMGTGPDGAPFRAEAVLFVTFKDGLISRHRGMGTLDGLRLERVQRELDKAAAVQNRLLPLGTFTGHGYEVAGASIACRAIGGDFFDYFELPDQALGLAVADVAGKGPPAALLSAALQGMFGVHARAGYGPADVMARVNLALLGRAVPARFATMFYAVLADTGILHYCNAGHNPPLLIGRSDRQLQCGGPVVGVFEEAVFESESVQLHPGDLVVAFSDGVTEALSIDGSEFGEDRLLSVVKAHKDHAPAALVKHIVDAVQTFAKGARQSDDVTVVVLRYVDTA